MSGVNPVVLVQLINQYHRIPMGKEDGPRIFTFNRNNLIRVHRETEEEVKKRKSRISTLVSNTTEEALMEQLKKAVKGRIGKVWIDPQMGKIALPIDISTGESGYGMLPPGSRVKVPEGKKLRAFTYWEKVNDIDLSCFGIREDEGIEEFSWRSMYARQSEEITFSGDETSGYNGGSEFFDIRIDMFRKSHPKTRYLVFCNNVYSGINFSKCLCKAGFMIRDEEDSGEIFEPKTVQTSYMINCDSTFAYLFALDLKEREMIWLNVSQNSKARIAGNTDISFLEKYFTVTDVLDVAGLFRMAGEEVKSIEECDIAFTDRMKLENSMIGKVKLIRSYDFEEVLKVLSAG